MTARTNLDVAAEAINATTVPDDITDSDDESCLRLARIEARAALDAIHPALADLTPDEVGAIFEFAMDIAITHGAHGAVPGHAWEVLCRD